MKIARSKHSSLRGLAAGVILSSLLFGCSEDEPGTMDPGNGSTGPIVLESIILNPKSPGLGDTLRATAVVTSAGQNVGDFVSYVWTADGGTFLETDKTSVRWVAPSTSTMFTISVTANNKSNTVSGSENVFVGDLVPFIARDAGEMHPDANGDNVIYLSSSLAPTQQGFNGFGARINEAGTDRSIIAPNRSYQQNFNNDLTQLAQVTGPLGGVRKVQLVDLPSGLSTLVEVAPQGPLFRAPQLTEPYFSPNGRLVTYQAFLPDQFGTPAQGGVDTFVVYVYNVVTQVRKRVATEFTGFHPTFSNDGQYLVYVADRTSEQVWELYGLPVEVATDSVAVDSVTPPLQLTNTGGLMGSQGEIPDDLMKAWSPNPAEPILAITDDDDKLRLISTSGDGGSLVDIPGTVDDFVWASAGGVLAVTNGQTIYRVTPPSTVEELHTAMVGDRIDRLSWSPGADFIIFAVIRSQSSWFELLDVGGTLGLTTPLRITAATPQGEADLFETFFTTRPVWLSSEPTGYFLFFDQTTPRMSTLSISGLMP